MMKIPGLVLLLIFFLCSTSNAKGNAIPGAEQPELYLSLLKNKKIGMVVNHTSLNGNTHMVDFLIGKSVAVEKIFAPEHGFRGDALEGEKIRDGMDAATGIPVYSLYGKTRKPTPEHMKGLEIMIFDIQDVGCRFYTYISTLHLVMEACAENNVLLLVLDRPNPNGDYVAGPVLEPEFKSFVGMHPIPVVHGLTVGELAGMINGEQWLGKGKSCELKVIKVKNYSHKDLFEPPVRPSPNLPNYLSIRLYPSLCFFEATSVSIGRGTPFPFQVIGGTKQNLGNFHFVPERIPGALVHPLNEGRSCFGIDLRNEDPSHRFTLKFFLNFYAKFEKEEEFLTRESWLNTLAGTDNLIEQVRNGKSEQEVFLYWKDGLEKYKSLRRKYLLYPDFE